MEREDNCSFFDNLECRQLSSEFYPLRGKLFAKIMSFYNFKRLQNVIFFFPDFFSC